MKIQLYIRWAFAYFLLIVLIGTAMRWSYVVSPFFEYQYVLHTHSHIALLGWIYIGITSLAAKQFLPTSVSKKYNRLFWMTQFTIIGMLFSFPFQGYGLYSIIFSTLFLVVSYLFVGFFIRRTPTENKKLYSYKWVRLALWTMVLSSLGPLALGYIMSKFGREAALYRGAIYFYLHFQYNGFMLTSLVGLFLRYLEQKKVFLSSKIQKISLWAFGLGIFLTLPLSWTGLVDMPIFYPVGGLGVVLQMIALMLLIREFIRENIVLPTTYNWLFKLIATLFLTKLGMQFLSSIPWVAQRVFFNVDMIIGYLHFIFLGVISLSLLYLLVIYKEVKFPKCTIMFFILIFFATEILIFYKGFALFFGYGLFSDYFRVLAGVTTLFLIPVSSFYIYLRK